MLTTFRSCRFSLMKVYFGSISIHIIQNISLFRMRLAKRQIFLLFVGISSIICNRWRNRSFNILFRWSNTIKTLIHVMMSLTLFGTIFLINSCNLVSYSKIDLKCKSKCFNLIKCMTSF